MSRIFNYFEKLKLTKEVSWFSLMLLFVWLYPFINEIIVFTLVKLYEFFIQQNKIPS